MGFDGASMVIQWDFPIHRTGVTDIYSVCQRNWTKGLDEFDSSRIQHKRINYGKTLQMVDHHVTQSSFPLLVNRPQITHPWTNLGGILEQGHQGHPYQ